MLYTINADGKKSPFWDKEKQQYQLGKKPVTDKYLYKLVAQKVKKYEDKNEKLTTRFVNGNISFEDWQVGMGKNIRESHVVLVRLGKGGKDNTFANDYLQVGRDLKNTHYKAFNIFAQDVSEGKLTKKQIIARSKLYGSASKNSFEKSRLSLYKQDSKIGRRRLGSCANHCPDCIGYAKLGWQKLTDIIPPGQDCQCRMNCCCSIEIKK